MITKAVIFDLDGVLVDSYDAWYHATSTVLKSLGRRITKKEYRNYWGVSFKDAIKDWVEIDKKSIDRISKKHDKIFENNLDKIKIMPYAKQTVRNLKRKGIRTAIVSNGHKNIINHVLKNFDMNFDVVIGAGDKYPKPSPRGINQACRLLKIRKGESVFIGDTKTDIKAGRNAKIKTIIVKKDICDLRDIIKLID